MTATAHTPGPWDFACDSYGKVQHSRKACVFTTVTEPAGDRLITIAARIDNWDDARLIAAAPVMADYIRHQAARGDTDAKAILANMVSNDAMGWRGFKLAATAVKVRS